MTELDEHRHCRVCGRVCDPDEEVCSKSCRAKREAQLASRRQLTWLLYAGMAVLALLLVIQLTRA